METNIHVGPLISKYCRLKNIDYNVGSVSHMAEELSRRVEKAESSSLSLEQVGVFGVRKSHWERQGELSVKQDNEFVYIILTPREGGYPRVVQLLRTPLEIKVPRWQDNFEGEERRRQHWARAFYPHDRTGPGSIS